MAAPNYEGPSPILMVIVSTYP